MVITKDQIKAIAPVKDLATEIFLPHINNYMGEVNTPLRFSAFIANVLHESGCFRYVHELASGEAYELREDLGNIYPGDGKLFKGRGLIQLTGRTNYTKISKDWYNDDRMVKNPDLLATPENAVRSAYWFWNTHKLNELADIPDFVKVVKRINGGLNHFDERKSYYDKALQLLGQ